MTAKNRADNKAAFVAGQPIAAADIHHFIDSPYFPGDTIPLSDVPDAAADSTVSSHIANTSNPHSVTKAQIGLSNVANIKDNTATTNPTADDDSGDGYSARSFWLNTDLDRAYICLDATVGAAVWVNLSEALGSHTHVPGDITGLEDYVNGLISDAQDDALTLTQGENLEYVEDTGAGTLTEHSRYPGNFHTGISNLDVVSVDPGLAASGTPPTAGLTYYVRVPIPFDTAFSEVAVAVGVAGSNLGAVYYAVFDDTGARLALSADVSSSFTSTGEKAIPLGTTLTRQGSRTASVYVAFLFVNNTSIVTPTLYRQAANAIQANLGFSPATTGGYRFSNSGAGQTSIPSSIDLATLTQGSGSYSLGLR